MKKINSKYRDNAISPVELRTAFIMGPNYDNIVNLCLAATADMSREEYHMWRQHWKEAYNSISEQLRKLKTMPDQQAVVAYARRIANTLINARQVAIDRHRSRNTA